MTDYNRTVPAYNEPLDRAGVAYRAPLTTTGPIFGGMDFVAGVVAALMIIEPLAMAAFWAP